MLLAERAELGPPRRGEREAHDALVPGVRAALDEAERLRPVDHSALTADGPAQRLFPVVAPDGGLVGVVTENLLGAAGPADPVTALLHDRPVCAHANDTLRQAALVMAATGVTRLVVTDRTDPSIPVAVVSLQQLLTGRVRDLHEATHHERVLRLRFSGPGRPGPDVAAPDVIRV